VSEFTETTHGEFMSRLTNDVDMVSNTLGQGITRFFETILMLVLTFSYMLYLSPVLTLVACITLPLTYIFGRIIVITSRKLFRERQKCLGEINGFVEQIFTGQKTVAAFSREKICKAQFLGMVERLRSISIKAETLGGIMGPTMNMLNNLNFLLVAAIGGWLASKPDSAISVGLIVTFTLFSRNFGRPVNMLANQFNEIQSAIAGAERVFKLLDTSKEQSPAEPINIDKEKLRGELVFKDVSFGYKPEQLVLENFNAVFSPGKKIALVGETGCGKTTIISLISRFFEIGSGSIELDGVDIRNIPHKVLRSKMAVVLQDTHLFSGTIRDNIAFGKPDATDEEIRAAAQLAFADHFIDRLPNKYETKINQADTALSQGQCQLLAIARAALANPAILILDEATSYVDTRTEKHIQEAMLRLMENRTSIIIAHRLSTIRNADTILVLDKGQIIEQGTHAELMALNGRYTQMNCI
jgi:ATP-binding cassette subfamily B protein